MTAPAMSKVQQLIYNKAELGVAYTVHGLAGLGVPFKTDMGVLINGTPKQFDEIWIDPIQGLCEYGYFVPAVDPYGTALDLEHWTFTKVANPSVPDAPAPTPSWVIPWTIQGQKLVGVAPSA